MDKRIISQAMQCSDELVVTLDYVDSKGKSSSRVVSPIRYLSTDRFLALCLCRCEPRQFQIDRCSNLKLRPAANYIMPVAMSSAI